jgi:hypothetical protein
MVRLATIVALGLLLIGAGTAQAQAYKPPRTPSGHPDFQGLWAVTSTTKLERPGVYPTLVITEAQAKSIARPEIYTDDDVGQEDTEFLEPGWELARIAGGIRTSWLIDPPDGRLPYTPQGAALVARPYTSDGPESRNNNDRCLTMLQTGPPMLNGGGANIWQILQTRDHVVILMEGNHETRRIPLRTGAARPQRPPDWHGHSMGWYEGDTLVVRTTGFHPQQSLRRSTFGRLYLSSDAVVTERFVRTSPGDILYRYTVHDPAVFTRDWTAEMPLRSTGGPLFEYACHEGNYSMAGRLAGARRQEADAAAAAGR